MSSIWCLPPLKLGGFITLVVEQCDFFFFQFPDGILSSASLNLGFDNLNTVDLHFLLFASVHLVEGTSVPVCFLAAQPYDLFVSKPTGATPAS